jgi:hypothetical protein
MHDVFTWSIHSKKSALEFATSREFWPDFFGSPIWYHLRTALTRDRFELRAVESAVESDAGDLIAKPSCRPLGRTRRRLSVPLSSIEDHRVGTTDRGARGSSP